ncbi:flagellar biosynthesis protein FlhF [Vibrio sp. WJH972]
MKAALLQVKEELGSDAVIMSNKKVAGGVEIVAAVDGDNTLPKSSAQQYNSQPRHKTPAPVTRSAPLTRNLADDQVQLGRRGGQNEAPMTKRFADLLNQYSTDDSSADNSEQADSLDALLKRQAKGSQSDQGSSRKPSQNRRGNETASNSLAGGRGGVSKSPNMNVNSHEESDGELNLMREDINSIRRLLEHQVSGLMWQEVERREPLRAMLIKRLERMGVSSELADQLACYIPEDTAPPKAWKALLRLVADQIPVAKKDILKRGGIVALLGPTGVGKTTTIAKLAARAAMEYGSDSVALVTTDTFRIGAHEQLAIYGKIMGCPVKVAKDSNDLADVIHQLRNRRLVLVDTAGMGQRDVRLSEQLDTLMQNSGENIHSYLVLPATAQRKVLQETIDHFRRIPLSGCIMTKLDESLSLGEFVSVIVQNALPVAYIANGQRVPEDIVLAQPKFMVAKANELLEDSDENEPRYWSSDSEGY